MEAMIERAEAVPERDAVHPARDLAYMRQDCPMTLREGLDEYYGTIEGLITEENASSKRVADLFRYHDTVHVVFGCDTSPVGETFADTWAILASDASWEEYREYFDLPEVKGLFASIGWWRSLLVFSAAMFHVPRAIVHALRVKKKWPFVAHERYLDRPLAEIRAEHGIRVVER